MKSLVVVACVLVASLPARAQSPRPSTDPPLQGPTFRTGVDVITVDVSAVDGRGQPVDGLLAPDFVVKIDGQPRRVVSVEQVRVDVEAAKHEQVADPVESFFSTNLTPPNGRLIVIAVDQLNIKPGDVRQVLAAAARFIDNLSPADRVAFYAYPEPGASVGFTSDRGRIRHAMEGIVGAQDGYKSHFNIGIYEAVQVTLKHDDLTLGLVVNRECRSIRGPALDECERQIVSDMALMVNRIREDRISSLRGLRDLLTRLALVDGPKSLILLSEGLVLNDSSELDEVVRTAALARASVNVLMMDVQRGSDMTTAVMPPTRAQDRDLQTNGLRDLASSSRGALFNVFGAGDNVFDQLASELSAYYLIGVEEEAGDRNDKAHRIDIEVRRRGVSLRSRRAFVLSEPKEQPAGDRLSEVLGSPFGVSEIPLRLTTYALQDPKSEQVRLVLAADVGQPGAAPGKFSVGWALFDAATGEVALSGGEERTLSPPRGRNDAALAFSTSVLVDPGTYILRLGAIDERGRRGSVIRDVSAWKMTGEAFAVGDLVVGATPGAGEAIQARVEPHVEREVAALVELYSNDPTLLDRTTVVFEVADSEDAKALMTVAGTIQARGQQSARFAQAVVGATTLPPGPYIVRARIRRDGAPVGLLARPFVLDPPATAGSTPTVASVPWSLSVPTFNVSVAMTPALVTQLLDDVERRSPDLKDAVAEARAGRYGAGSLEALGAGDQAAAAFLKGLDFYAKGQIDQAAAQLQIAAGPRREFFPAAFFLGATYAAAGRDRDAASVWQMALGSDPHPSLAYALFADARFRAEQPQSVIDVLEPAFRRTPLDDEIGRRLASAYLLTGQYASAVPLFVSYLGRHPDDQAALFAGIVAEYEAASRAGVSLSDVERARLTGWARAYRGDEQALVARYLEALQVR